jgi:hypothetical protein
LPCLSCQALAQTGLLYEVLVFLFQLLEPPQSKYVQATVFFLPVIVGSLANAHFAANPRLRSRPCRPDAGRTQFGPRQIWSSSGYCLGFFKVRQLLNFLYFTGAYFTGSHCRVRPIQRGLGNVAKEITRCQSIRIWAVLEKVKVGFYWDNFSFIGEP